MSKDKLKFKMTRPERITVFLKQYDSSGRHESDTICDAHRVYRIEVLMSFMRAGVPISKLKFLRDILEENSMRLIDPSHMLQLGPSVFEQEKYFITLSLPKCFNFTPRNVHERFQTLLTPVLTIFTDFLSAVVTSEIAQILSLYGGEFLALKWQS